MLSLVQVTIPSLPYTLQQIQSVKVDVDAVRKSSAPGRLSSIVGHLYPKTNRVELFISHFHPQTMRPLRLLHLPVPVRHHLRILLLPRRIITASSLWTKS